MDTRIIAQPTLQVGKVLVDLLESRKDVKLFVLVSAFVNRQTLLRLKSQVKILTDSGAKVRLVVGIDLDGTSEEALREILAWDEVECRVVKNTLPGHTFHPKIYLIESELSADLIVGSSNLTDGGLYKNYEAAAHLTFDLPKDQEAYQTRLREIAMFVDPFGPDVRELSAELIEQLLGSGVVHSEIANLERRRKSGVSDQSGSSRTPLPFDRRPMPSPPPLPSGVVRGVIKRIRQRTSNRNAKIRSDESLTPTSFYMVLNRLQGPNIPGEVRVPLSARDAAPEFWGWPTHYKEETRSQGEQVRTYWNWKPKWNVGDGATSRVENVRMYAYEERAEFRFFAPFLRELGANEGDIVRITRIGQGSFEYDCEVAIVGTEKHAEWIQYCSVAAQGGRLYGYA